MPKAKYQYPRLNAGDNSYNLYFTNEFKRRELDMAYTWSTNEKRGSAFLWDQLGEKDPNFLKDSVFVIIRRKDNRTPVYSFYVTRDFWYNSQKAREDHDYIQAHANIHLDKLQNSIKWKKS